MNIKDYIESGILEAYILGALTPDEVALVEANIIKFPELGEELLAIENAMQQFSAQLSMNPPDALQDKIWNAIQESAVSKNYVALNDGSIKKAAIIPLTARKIEWKYAAALIFLVGSVLLNILFWKQGKDARDENIVLNTKMESLQSQQSRLATLVGNFQKEKTMMADTGMQTVVMHTIQAGHPMAATVYWSKKEGLAYVSIDALPTPPAGMQYQLWVMQDGKPVDMGVIANDLASTPGMQKVAKAVTAGQAFAISLEKAGGSPTPTMQNIYVMGTAS